MLFAIPLCSAAPQTFLSPQFASRPLVSPPVISTPVVAAPVVSHAQHTSHCSYSENEVVQAEICVPAFETKCTKDERKVKVIVEQDQCADITTPVCTETAELVEKEICTNTYRVKKQSGEAQTAEITIGQQCKTELHTVCQATAAYGYHHYGHQYCKDVPHQTCYQVPQVSPKGEPVEVAAPEPATNCQTVTISVPKVDCEDIVTKRCIKVPTPVDNVEQVDKCDVSPSATPSCKTVNLSLPKKSCVHHAVAHHG